jgi:hypothetical protein
MSIISFVQSYKKTCIIENISVLCYNRVTDWRICTNTCHAMLSQKSTLKWRRKHIVGSSTNLTTLYGVSIILPVYHLTSFLHVILVTDPDSTLSNETRTVDFPLYTVDAPLMIVWLEKLK